jgi:hypothetical protein
MPDVMKQKMTAEELRKARKASEEMADIEFEMEIAPYTNYTGPIDSSIARYRGFEGLSGDTDLSLGGFYVPPEDQNDPYTDEELKGYVGQVGGVDLKTPTEPNTINAVHNQATPNIWAHEYRHKEYPGLSEGQNRLIDGSMAMNESDWNNAVKMYRDKFKRKGKKITKSEAERELIADLESDMGSGRFGVATNMFGKEFRDKGGNLPESKETWWSTDKQDYERMRREQVYWPKRKAELDEFDEWNNAIAKHNEERRKDNS